MKIVVVTSDERKYEIDKTLLGKYSQLFQTMLQSENFQQEIKLLEVDSEAFEIILQFIQLHKEIKPSSLHFPLKSNQNVKFIMEQADAMLVTSIINKNDNLLLFRNVLQGSSYLVIQDFVVRLIAGLNIKLQKCTLDELKQEFQLEQEEIDDEQLRNQCCEYLINRLEFEESQIQGDQIEQEKQND